MKKNLTLSLTPILCTLFVLSFLFTACSEETDGPAKDETPATVAISYSFSMNQEYLNLTDVTIVFWNDKGEKLTETMTTTTWKKEFKLTQSQEFGYTVTVVAKSNIDELLTAASYKLSTEYTDSYSSSTGKGEFPHSSRSMTVSKEKVKELIAPKTEYHKFSKKWNKESDTFTN